MRWNKVFKFLPFPECEILHNQLVIQSHFLLHKENGKKKIGLRSHLLWYVTHVHLCTCKKQPWLEFQHVHFMSNTRLCIRGFLVFTILFLSAFHSKSFHFYSVDYIYLNEKSLKFKQDTIVFITFWRSLWVEALNKELAKHLAKW